MSLQSYDDPRPDKWVTLGGVNKQGVKNPTSAEGFYLGRTEGINQFDASKTKVTFMLKTPSGTLGVNASVNLITRMTTSERNFMAKEGKSANGAFVVITFLGEEPSGKGNPMKLFSVKFDPENIDTTAADTVLARGSSYADDEDTSSTNGADEDAEQNVALAAAERAAKVKALLANKGKVTR